jgi:hypothetical protein
MKSPEFKCERCGFKEVRVDYGAMPDVITMGEAPSYFGTTGCYDPVTLVCEHQHEVKDKDGKVISKKPCGNVVHFERRNFRAMPFEMQSYQEKMKAITAENVQAVIERVVMEQSKKYVMDETFQAAIKHIQERLRKDNAR